MKSYRKGVGALIVNEQDLIFVANRIDMPLAWQMPQGGVDEGESPKEALLRELEEEIGTNDVVILNQTKDWLRYDFPKDIQQKMRSLWGDEGCLGQEQIWFLCKMENVSSINLKTPHPEFLEFKWLTPDNVLAECVDFKKDLYKNIFIELLNFY
ncbi:MAG: RNA pyrophosphohydrolase [Proteobacteria bacterium]|nr:RNA pyrophosphohydrolase [Pseudomonadota bacterium]